MSVLSEPPIDHRPASLMDRLKAGTDRHHRHAETRRLQREMAKGTIDSARYRAYIAQLLHVHKALDRWLSAAESCMPAIRDLDHGHHRHVTNLERDIRDLGTPEEKLGPLPETARFIAEMDERMANEPAHVLAVFYVLEGSMNGNRFIARALAAAFGRREGLSYLDPYGETQRETWLRMRMRINALSFPEPVIEALLETAQATFDAIAAISDSVTPPPAPSREA